MRSLNYREVLFFAMKAEIQANPCIFLTVHLQSAPDNLSGLSLQPPCKCQSPVFFLSLAMCLMMYLGKINHPGWYIFAWSLCIMQASPSHWASRLLHCEREAFLKRSSKLQPPRKCQSPGYFSMSSYVSDDVSGKNSASWVIYFCLEPLYCIMQASLSHWANRLLHCKREAFLKMSSRQKYFF